MKAPLAVTFPFVLLLLLPDRPGLAQPAISFISHRIHAVTEPGQVLHALAPGDFDGDGAIDFVVSGEAFGRNLLLMQGDGSGGLDLVSDMWSWPAPSAVDTADLDRDGALDLVAGHFRPEIVVHFGDGAFGFPRSRVLLGPGTCNAVLARDLDGDGILDIISSHGSFSEGSVAVFLGMTGGMFAPPVLFDVDPTPRSMVVGDFNGDGHQDAVTLHEFDNTITLLLGDGSGGFSTVTSMGFVQFRRPLSLVSGDFDLDGRLDLAAANLDNDRLVVLSGDGNGDFPRRLTAPLARVPRNLCVGDLNRDGLLDFVVTTHGPDPITGGGGTGADHRLIIRFGRPGGGLSDSLDLGVAEDTVACALTDLNGDGRLDLVGAIQYSHLLMSFDGAGWSGFATSTISDGGSGEPPLDLAVGELDGDGRPDLVVTHPGFPRLHRDSVAIHLGREDGTFHLESSENFVAPFNPTDLTVRIGDVSGDSVSDLTFLSNSQQQPGGVAWISVRLGDGQGGFDPYVHTMLDIEFGGHLLADFNGDGRMDVAVRDSGFTLRILLSQGDGTFSQLNRDEFSDDMTVGDYDEDGNPDLGVLREGRLFVLFGDGSGGFGPASDVGRLAPPALTLDVNGDGHVDVVGQGLATLIGDGAGLFSVGAEPNLPLTWFRSGDFDLDGFPDIAGFLDDEVVVARNDGTGDFSEVGSFSAGTRATTLGVGDFDADSRPDVVAAQWFSGNPVETALVMLHNRTFDVQAALEGNVNAAAGPVADVLFVNGSPGVGPHRVLTVNREDPFEIRIESVPATQTSRYVVWAALGLPSGDRLEDLPFGVGTISLFTPVTGYEVAATWNTIGLPAQLGHPTFPSDVAPAVLLSLSGGVGQPGRFRLQGVILDPASMQGQAAVTNGVVVQSE